ncbi:alpha/beta hydrolase [Caldimonas sp. KR1-144]|uniref:alpha/beta hydrolase n=1 Tax=Caldimonas sp. KR1-144 TaxID=3400911 RepID=UPI003C01C1A5
MLDRVKKNAPRYAASEIPFVDTQLPAINPGAVARDGRKPTIVFAHANGFPAGTYRVLFEAWRAAGYEVRAIERIGHDAAYPVTSNWPHLRQQLADFVLRESDGPAFLVGHSLGGFLSLMVALEHRPLAAGVVMIDSPLIYGWKARMVQLAKATGWVGQVSPGRVSRKRRDRWSDAAEVHRHFESKPAFARWDARVLADYVASGTVDSRGERELAFDRAVETAIYNTLPHHIEKLVRRAPPDCPVAFIGGTISAEVRQVGLAATRRLTQGRMAQVEGSHLFPMERPDETARIVLEQLEKMRG